MTPRERVQLALSHQKPDRVPRYEIFLPGYVQQWKKDRCGKTSDDIYGDYNKIDIGTVLAMQEGPFVSRMRQEEGDGNTYLLYDSWGRVQKCSHSGTFYQVLETALSNKSDLDVVAFEEPWTNDRIDYYQQWEARSHDRFCPVSGVMGLFMSSYYLRGEFELLIDLHEDEEFCRHLAERVAKFLTQAGEKTLDVTNTWDTAIWVYDELGNNQTSMISPKTFERIYLEPYREMIGRWKERGVKNVILHCDGNCLPLVDLLIDAGFTGIQGNNPSAGMTIPQMKARYGNRLALIGGMCNIHVLTSGNRREIEHQVAEIMDVARDGGVVIGTHSIDSDIPVENYDYYYEIVNRMDEQA
ncbi:MAG: hypothetical protein JW936_06035 [Sedimentisphaerales bacterium]|nr:hypothetical protein [Sedimentisphaerales bacterium]